MVVSGLVQRGRVGEKVGMRYLSSTPVLPVREMARGVAFYRDVLGFEVLHEDANYAVLRRDASGIHLWRASDESWRGNAEREPIVSGAESFLAGTSGCRVEVEGVEDLHEHCRLRGCVHPNGPLQDRPWGSREFAVLDPDGNVLTFYESRASRAGLNDPA